MVFWGWCYPIRRGPEIKIYGFKVKESENPRIEFSHAEDVKTRIRPKFYNSTVVGKISNQVFLVALKSGHGSSHSQRIVVIDWGIYVSCYRRDLGHSPSYSLSGLNLNPVSGDNIS